MQQYDYHSSIIVNFTAVVVFIISFYDFKHSPVDICTCGTRAQMRGSVQVCVGVRMYMCVRENRQKMSKTISTCKISQ